MGLEWLDPTHVWCVIRNPQGLHRLSVTAVKHASKPGWYSDGGGLYLEVDKAGRKRWAMRLVVAGKRRDFGLGPIHKVSLLQARECAEDYRAKAYAGIDPAAERRAHRKRVEPVRKVLTFEDAAIETHQSRKLMWSNGKHVSQWLHSLRDYAYPLIGAKPVNAIGTPDIMAVLTPIWTTKPETARRVRQRLKAVLEWARAAGHRSGDNPVDAIGPALPKHSHEHLDETREGVHMLWAPSTAFINDTGRPTRGGGPSKQGLIDMRFGRAPPSATLVALDEIMTIDVGTWLTSAIEGHERNTSGRFRAP